MTNPTTNLSTKGSRLPRFKTKDPVELERAVDYLAKLAGREAVVDIIRVTYQRSLNSNAYYHLVLSFFGTQVGSTLDDVKALIRELQPTLYNLRYTTVAGVRIQSSRSSAEFTAGEMAESIDRFRLWASEQGIDIPAPNETELLKYADDTVAANKSYL